MNKLNKYFGLFLIYFSFLAVIISLYNTLDPISRLYSGIYPKDAQEGLTIAVIFAIISFCIFFFPGRIYYKASKEITKENMITNIAVIIGLFSFILCTVLLLIFNIIPLSDPESGAFASLFAIELFVIVYIISVLFGIIGTFKK